ncbi:DNA adenine methylase [Helicobacter suis]|uniref:DNA adenine methylase n=1 Tax=Helicobacter suis TaxID=104628 RepID=UPI0013D6680B|nr:DNA adenine methylase [Helicobacter suis]
MKLQSKHLCTGITLTPSPLRYPGGKGVLSPFVKGFLVEQRLLGSVFVECFCGGAGLGLSLLLDNVVDHLYLNDLDINIYAIWHSILYETQAFIEKIQTIEVHLEQWHKQKEVLNNPPSLLDLGFAAFFLNRCNVSGFIHKPPIGGYKQEGKYLISHCFNRVLLTQKIKSIAARLNRITISNKDALDFISSLDLPKAVLLYCDPPYYTAGKQTYKKFFTQQQHTDLATRLRGLNAPWLCSYDNHPHIQELYKDCYSLELCWRYNASKSKVGQEMLYSNYELVKERSLWD